MSANVVVLILGILVIGYAVYFTHTILRRRLELQGAAGSRSRFTVGRSTRQQLADEVGAAGELRALSAAEIAADVDRAGTALAASPELLSSRCLWVDDQPDAQVHERRMLELLRVEIDLARSTNQALQFLAGRKYDFVVSDLARPVASGGVDDRAGIKLLKMLAGAPTVPPLIVYGEPINPTGDADDSDPDDSDADDSDADDSDADDETPVPGSAETGRADAIGADGFADVRFADARAAGARATVNVPSALLRSVLDVVADG